jgi:hypothetical protein
MAAAHSPVNLPGQVADSPDIHKKGRSSTIQQVK